MRRRIPRCRCSSDAGRRGDEAGDQPHPDRTARDDPDRRDSAIRVQDLSLPPRTSGSGSETRTSSGSGRSADALGRAGRLRCVVAREDPDTTTRLQPRPEPPISYKGGPPTVEGGAPSPPTLGPHSLTGEVTTRAARSLRVPAHNFSRSVAFARSVRRRPTKGVAGKRTGGMRASPGGRVAPG